MKRINWTFIIIVLIGFVIGSCLGSYFQSSFLSYGQTFGLSSPVVLDLGFVILTFGLQIKLTISSILGVILALIVYRFIK